MDDFRSGQANVLMATQVLTANMRNLHCDPLISLATLLRLPTLSHD